MPALNVISELRFVDGEWVLLSETPLVVPAGTKQNYKTTKREESLSMQPWSHVIQFYYSIIEGEDEIE